MDRCTDNHESVDIALVVPPEKPEFSRAYFRDTEGFLIGGPNDVIIPAVCYALLERGYDPDTTTVQFYQRLRSKDPHLDQHRLEMPGPRVQITESILRAWETHSALLEEHGFRRVSKFDPETPLGALSP